MTGTHALAVEALAQAEPERERIEADPAVEPRVRATVDLARDGDAVLDEVGRARNPQVPGAICPGGGLLAGIEEEELEPVAEALREPGDDACVEEEAGRKRIRKDEPDRRHEVARARSAMAIRSASEEPSSPW